MLRYNYEQWCTRCVSKVMKHMLRIGRGLFSLNRTNSPFLASGLHKIWKKGFRNSQITWASLFYRTCMSQDESKTSKMTKKEWLKTIVLDGQQQTKLTDSCAWWLKVFHYYSLTLWTFRKHSSLRRNWIYARLVPKMLTGKQMTSKECRNSFPISKHTSRNFSCFLWYWNGLDCCLVSCV